MKFNQAITKTAITFSLILGSCSSPSTQTPPPNPFPSQTSAPIQTNKQSTNHTKPTKGGQVVETDKFHMELVPVVEEKGVHLDFYLQTGTDHQAIAGAKVTAQIEFPDRSQQLVEMEYDAAGEHYFAFLPSQAKGQFKVVVLTEVNREKSNGRFSFTN